MLTIRVRHAGGMLRVETAKPDWTLAQLEQAVREKLSLPSTAPVVLSPSPPSSSSTSASFADDTITLREAGLGHGALLFLNHKLLPPTVVPTAATAPSKTIDVEGNLVATSRPAGAGSNGSAAFRPGLLSLRDQKLHWTLTEMTELDDSFTFVIKGKEPNFCSQVSLDLDSAQDFQRFCAEFNSFTRTRCSLMFGRFLDNAVEEKQSAGRSAAGPAAYGKTKAQMRVRDLKTEEEDQLLARQRVQVEFFFDPEMESEFRIAFDSEGVQNALAIANALGMQCVGIIFSHAKRSNTFDSSEILLCGEACLEATNGKTDSPFVICKVCPENDPTTAAAAVQMDAFQLTKTCLEMQREEALLAMGGENKAFCAVDPKFTVMIEAKPSEVVDCDYFIKRVPIVSHRSNEFTMAFPRANRHDAKWNANTLRGLVSRLGNGAAEWRRVLRDFHLLYFLVQALGVETVVDICHEITSEEAGDFPEGFVLMVKEACN